MGVVSGCSQPTHSLQVSKGVNVLTENLVPHMQPGHRIGVVSGPSLLIFRFSHTLTPNVHSPHIPSHLHFLTPHTPTQPEPLFTKIEESIAKLLREKFAGKQGGMAKKESGKATPTNTADLQKQLDDQVTYHRSHCV